jgi:glycosyltransferase involved in cell wall biosynthesis
VKVSIAMATYNGARYIREQLDSFSIQTRLPDELVVCDDCSTDETIQIVNNFKKHSPFNIKVLSNENQLGHTKNFEKAILHCAGDIIFISDQDDVWHKEKIEEHIKLYNENKSHLMIVNNMEIVNDNLKNECITLFDFIKSKGHGEESYIFGCGVSIKRDFKQISLPFPDVVRGKFGHDTWLVGFANALKVNHIHYKSLQLYRRHDSNLYNINAISREKINITNIIKSIIYDEAPQNWMIQISIIKLYRSQIEKNIDKLIELVGETKIKEIMQLLDEKMSFLNKRFEISKVNRLSRINLICKLYLSGFYDNNKHALLSVAKDLIRPINQHR